MDREPTPSRLSRVDIVESMLDLPPPADTPETKERAPMAMLERTTREAMLLKRAGQVLDRLQQIEQPVSYGKYLRLMISFGFVTGEANNAFNDLGYELRPDLTIKF